MELTECYGSTVAEITKIADDTGRVFRVVVLFTENSALVIENFEGELIVEFEPSYDGV